MTELLYEVLIFLGAAVVAVPISKQLGLGSVLGYLIAGIVAGPLLGLIGDEAQEIQHVAEFGVVMMLFLVGLELEPEKLWELRHKLFGLGGFQVLLTISLFTVGAMFFGLSFNEALVVGMLLSLSSTAIVLQTLNERGLMTSTGGQSSFTVLLFQDIAVIPMLAVIPLLALPELVSHTTDNNHHSGNLLEGVSPWLRAFITVVVIGAIVFVGRYLSRPLFRYIAKARLREVFTAYALFIVVGVAVLMSMIGLSPALGAFVAGVVLANSEYRHELESNIEPFKGLLLGVFFITVGAGINFTLLHAELLNILALTSLVVIGKFAVLFCLAIVFKLRGADRWLFALGLAQTGEFGFVLLSFSLQNGAITSSLSSTLMLVVALSMLITPLLFIFLDKVLMPRFAGVDDVGKSHKIDVKSPIIIAGHGRFGQIVTRNLMACGFQPTIVDLDIESIEGFSKLGLKTYFGDASRPAILATAGIESAKLLVVAVDDKHRALEIVNRARMANPSIAIVARSFDRLHTYDMYKAGANQIVRETFDSSIRSSKLSLEALGMDTEVAQKVTKLFFDRDRLGVRKMADAYDPEMPRFTNQKMIDIALAHNEETAQLIQQLIQTCHQTVDPEKGVTSDPCSDTR
ncbi:MAG: monovalent cation:proton antiporter-2 (CPA2) family protein [Gammaproteobacteria bacterium]|nr:monovalent cation:proton antiporter-2 (CPA2) family protein [Gammaproteobacteria bacterium]